MNLDYPKMCGKHIAIYEAYYKQIDPKGSGAIEAMTAAKFLKKSGLSDVVLSRVWDMSDPNGKGFLDKPGFFVALKLVSVAQAGHVVNISNIYVETINPPKVGDLPKIIPPRVQNTPVPSSGAANADWSISVIDRLKYEQLFESLKPVGGMLPGNKVKGVLMDSKLPMDTLGTIWDLADQDKDGNLDKHEFIVAMHLVYQTLEKRTVPNVLPPELRKPGSGGPPPPKPAPPVAVATVPRAPSGEGFSEGGFVANFPKDIAPPPAIQPLPPAVPSMARVPPVGGTQPLIPLDPLVPIAAPPSVTAKADWVVTPSELQRYEVIFRDSDRDKDGLVSGLEIKNIFLQSGVSQHCLAHIWALCDTNQSGKLTLEQFALAMWMVERKQQGIEPPQVLTAVMVPPSMRGIVSGIDLQPQVEPKPTYSNPELEMISKEIEELSKERRSLETEIAQKEADIRIKSGEVRSLQSELDTLSATLKQLENQRGEAQKRLDDLKAQVNKIRDQCQKQEETINEQEGELNAKRSELQKLKDEETALQKEYDENNRELQKLTQHLQNTQLQISSVRSMVTQLMETQRQMTDALLMCRAAIENQDTELVSEYQLKIEPDFDDARKTLEKKIEEAKADPFEANSTSAVKASNDFGNTNGFGNDPFTSTNGSTALRSGFDDSFSTPSGFDSGFDAFGSNSGFNQQKDPFGGDTFGANKNNTSFTEPGKDDFGSDPFAALHAPTGQGQVLSPNAQKSGPPPRPESPSPALPPKKSKVPPPRPAPPRPLQGPARPNQNAMDAFGGTASSGGFENFADFDNKLPIIPITTRTLASNSEPLFDTSCKLPLTTSFPSSASASIPNQTTEISNNHLTHSPTPLQEAANAFSSSNSNLSAVPNTTVNSQALKSPTTASAPTDFADDPFKDYRYEDPFSIKDPFEDDDMPEDPDKIFKDDLSSGEDETKTKSINTDAGKTTNSQFNFSISSDFFELFSAINLNASPVPSQKSAASVKKTPRNSPLTASAGPVDDFANFDAFSSKTLSHTGNSADSNDVTTKNNDDAFFDAFNDNFNDNTKNGEPVKGAETTLNSKKFDAFGEIINADNKTLNANSGDVFNKFETAITATTSTTNGAIKKSPKIIDDFGVNSFEDDFFKINNDAQDINLNYNLKNKPENNMLNENFAKFDAFGDTTDFGVEFTTLNNNLNLTMGAARTDHTPASGPKLTKVQNFTTLPKTTNETKLAPLAAGEEDPKMPEKFADDYSNAENFDADLQEALKRSLAEK